ncbi:MAG TPA: hypothetical protein VGC66_01325 [Pyrinomonadaceae bacterium]|jgi:hypothetical protein
MSDQTAFDLDSFQNNVLKWIKKIQDLGEIEQRYKDNPLRAKPLSRSEYPGCLGLISFLSSKGLKGIASDSYQELKEHREQLTAEAEREIGQAEMRRRICPALQGSSNESTEIAKAITPILVPLAQTKAISTRLSSEHFAMIALVIAKRGITNYCTDKSSSVI